MNAPGSLSLILEQNDVHSNDAIARWQTAPYYLTTDADVERSFAD
jgi:hypothetical protein